MEETRTRIVELSAEIDRTIEAAVAKGEYPDADAAVGAALRDWKERRENWGYAIAELRAEIQKGIDSGPGRFDSIEDIRTEARSRFARRNSVP